MEKLKKITGTWRGIYHYDAAEKMPYLKPVPFTLVLKQGWFGHFTGNVNDDLNLGMPETGRIDGYFSFPKIEFTKLMPVGYFAMPDGRRISIRESLKKQGYLCKKEVPNPPILYRGEFSNSRHAQGIWIIEPGQIKLGEGKALNRNGWKGTWTMEAQAESVPHTQTSKR